MPNLGTNMPAKAKTYETYRSILDDIYNKEKIVFLIL